MIEKVRFGEPYEFGAVRSVVLEGVPLREFASEKQGEDLVFTLQLSPEEIVYGLGETMRGIDKRGGRYVMYNTDNNTHTDDMPSMYAAHNFIVLDSSTRHIGFFFDTPGRITFDVDSQHDGRLTITVTGGQVNVYQIPGADSYGIVREFLKAIGPSYIPPLWAFGYGQSRFGYKNADDVTEVVRRHHDAGVPLDYVSLDIDYMQDCADFTVNAVRFPHMADFLADLKTEGVRMCPIIDAGIKVDENDARFVAARDQGLFCTDAEGKPLDVAVWPGWTHLPDFFQPAARTWFGEGYKALTDLGLEGFWNDMNEPSIFFTRASQGARSMDIAQDASAEDGQDATDDYHRLYHSIDGRRVCNVDVHNAYGSLMVQASAEGLDRLLNHRYMLFARSSCIGGGRYGGIWTGDNASTWHMLQTGFRMMPNINMCGYLFTGTDTGGFMQDCKDRELLARWLAFSAFTPIMRNHSCKGTRHQEFYRFQGAGTFRRLISFRYRILPYIYSEYVKAALNNDMDIAPLAFHFPDDPTCRGIEDQVMVGQDVMFAPILKPHCHSRMVYLPEDMTEVEFDGENFIQTPLKAGWHRVRICVSHVVFFIRSGHAIPVARRLALTTDDLDLEDVELIGDGAGYDQYLDDGLTRNISMENVRHLSR